MGCDIHEWVEVRVGGKWEMTDVNLDVGRNYDLFGMLADVRNGRGFAGVDTGDGFVPILGRESPTRGIPLDASPEYAAEVENWGGDGHSHSWLTLAELKAYDWHGQKTKKRAVVSLEDRKAWRDSGNPGPSSYCGGVSGSSVKFVPLDEMDRIIDRGQDTAWSYFSSVEWDTTYAESAEWFISNAMPKLEAYAAERGIDASDIRIVFFFDN